MTPKIPTKQLEILNPPRFSHGLLDYCTGKLFVECAAARLLLNDFCFEKHLNPHSPDDACFPCTNSPIDA